MRAAVDAVYDPLRKKNVACTPEERVRQWFILQLRDNMGVPAHLMMSEVAFKFGDKPYRADIVVYGRDGSPAAIVECKRPDVVIDADVAVQALRYDAVLSVRFIFLTNGTTTYIYRRVGATFEPCLSLPSCEEML